MTIWSFPTVDLQRLSDPDDVEELAKLRSALESWGLFAVTGHGVPESLMDGILDATREFFHLPAEEKLKHANRTEETGEFQPEGYGVDRVDTDEQVLDWCDRLYLTVEPESERQPRFWPPSSVSTLLHAYAPCSARVARLVLRGMARVLGFREEFFLGRVGENGGTYARFTYYPPCPRPDLVYGLKPHTDNSVVTVLLLDRDVAGLQVLLKKEEEEEEGKKRQRWVDVPVLRRGELLVVVGDEMEIMSNAAFRAPTHRVGDQRRQGEDVAGHVLPARSRAQGAEAGLRSSWTRRARPCTGRSRPRPFGDGFWDAFALGERTLDFLKVKIEKQDDEVARGA
ncbi:hypothetical protein PR202_gb17728 [Eleusine coracana subsp. coracana]|uniref:Fe2OG dioxygenase domain-containing protein n=1 Tax=Eleusine coracana subsp. coracana TaxID=191504 RepID=A0AAV5F3S7_ELECO|nr:hypothetical protein PR202_gb17728 [Eleusine coracana subsp. coracana]